MLRYNLLFCHSETAKQFKPDMTPSVASVFMVDILIMSHLLSVCEIACGVFDKISAGITLRKHTHTRTTFVIILRYYFYMFILKMDFPF